jgi:hypothetical protein
MEWLVRGGSCCALAAHKRMRSQPKDNILPLPLPLQLQLLAREVWGAGFGYGNECALPSAAGNQRAAWGIRGALYHAGFERG